MPTRSQLTHTARYDAFDTTITTSEIEAYKAQGGKNPGSAWIIAIVLIGFFSVAFFIGFIVTIANEYFAGSISARDWREASSLAYISVVCSAVLVPIWYLNKRGAYKAMARNIQMHRFAEDNDLDYNDRFRPNPEPRPGMIFNEGMERAIIYTMTPRAGAPFELGSHTHVTGAGRGRATHAWGYIEVATDADLPHVVLDAKRNNGTAFGVQLFTSLPKAFQKGNQVSVSPEVDELFITYSSDGKGDRIGHYFTPEFLSALTAMGNQFGYDFEVVDGKAYAYCTTPYGPTKDEMKRATAMIDLMVNTFGSGAELPTPTTDRTNETRPAVLASKTPMLVRTLGFIGITVQIIVAIGLLLSD